MAAILVLGGAGYIGSALCDSLMREGHQVTCVDNLHYGQNPPSSVPFIKADLSSLKETEYLLQELQSTNFQVIYNLAAILGVYKVWRYPRLCCNDNFAITNFWTKFIETWPDAKHIVTSSSEVYGNCDDCTEDKPLCIPNTTSLRGVYAASKVALEFVTACNSSNYLICRLFNITGPGQPTVHGMVLPKFISCVLSREPMPVYGDGKQTRSFCSLEQCVYALCRLAFVPEAKNMIVNVGSANPDTQVTIVGLAHRIAAFAKTKGIITQTVSSLYPYGPNAQKIEIQKRNINIERLCSLLPEYKDKFAHITLDEIIRMTWERME